MNQYRPTATATEISARDAARLVDEDARRRRRERQPISQALDDSGVRTDLRRRAEQDQAAVLQDQRDAERENELRVVALALGADDADAGDARDQKRCSR